MLVFALIVSILIITLVCITCDTAQVKTIVYNMSSPGNVLTMRDRQFNFDSSIVTTRLVKPWLPSDAEERIPVYEAGINRNTDTVVMFSCNMSHNMTVSIAKLSYFLQLGYGVVTFDYSGYGDNIYREIERKQSGLVSTYKVVLDYVINTHSSCDIVCVGEGFSAGVVLNAINDDKHADAISAYCLVNPIYKLKYVYTDLENDLIRSISTTSKPGFVIMTPNSNYLNFLSVDKSELVLAIETADKCTLKMASRVAWVDFAQIIDKFIKLHTRL